MNLILPNPFPFSVYLKLDNYSEIWADLFKPRSTTQAAFINTLRYVVYGVSNRYVQFEAICFLLFCPL